MTKELEKLSTIKIPKTRANDKEAEREHERDGRGKQ